MTMRPKLSLRQLNLSGRRVLLRVDFNVPLGADGRVADDARLRAVLPTLSRLVGQGARIVCLSHLGRPKGNPDPGLSLRPVAEHLSNMIHRPVAFADDCAGDEAKRVVASLGEGQISLLENVRFHPGEAANEADFAGRLASLGEVFVNDAFGAAHRASASTVGIPSHLPSAAGLLMQREIEALSRLLEPDRPFAAIVGGAKIADKLSLLGNLLGRIDAVMLGGGLANTFLAARGVAMGDSLVEEDRISDARQFLVNAEKAGVEVILPTDLVVARSFHPESRSHREAVTDGVSEGWLALDIGPETVRRFRKQFKGKRVLFWNGPMGVAEWPRFSSGTAGVARAVAAHPGYTVVGGGDSLAALRRAGLDGRIDHVSTGGGASLAFLEGRELPAIAALSDGEDVPPGMALTAPPGGDDGGAA